MEKMLPRLLGENVEVSLLMETELGQLKADQHQIEQVIMNSDHSRCIFTDRFFRAMRTGHSKNTEEAYFYILRFAGCPFSSTIGDNRPVMNLGPAHKFRRCTLSRFTHIAGLASLGLVLALSGCQKPTDQAAAPNTAASSPSNDASGSVPNASAGPSSSGNPARETVAPKPLVVPADTTIRVVLDEPLGSKTSSTGQNFSATVAAPVEVDGRIAIPKSARVTGVVRDAKSAGRFKGGAVLSISLSNVTVGGSTYDLRTNNHTQTSTGKGKRTAAMIGGGGAAGALIGGLAGGGKGAAIGAAVGAGAGTGGAGLTGNREIVLPAETPLTFKLLDPVEIKSRS